MTPSPVVQDLQELNWSIPASPTRELSHPVSSIACLRKNYFTACILGICLLYNNIAKVSLYQMLRATEFASDEVSASLTVNIMNTFVDGNSCSALNRGSIHKYYLSGLHQGDNSSPLFSAFSRYLGLEICPLTNDQFLTVFSALSSCFLLIVSSSGVSTGILSAALFLLYQWTLSFTGTYSQVPRTSGTCYCHKQPEIFFPALFSSYAFTFLLQLLP